MRQFLALNGWHMDPDPAGPVASMVTELANGARDTRSIADWLAPRLRPDGKGPTFIKETSMRRRNTLAERLEMATTRTQPKGLFGRFTGEARRAVHLAQPSGAGVAEQIAAGRASSARRAHRARQDAGDLERAAALRDRERQLLADKVRLEYQLAGEGDVQVVITETFGCSLMSIACGSCSAGTASSQTMGPPGLPECQSGSAAVIVPGDG
jgi:hypothetical protein